MSKCRAKDPRKCYYHAAVGQFVQRVARVKTGASEATIKKTLSELNKEGKNLPAPSDQDVQNWIDGKVLATEYDPDLTSEEREAQMKLLEQARVDVKAGVTGGRFHAWKNLVARLKARIGKPLIALSVIGVMSFGVAGCTTSNNTTPTASPTSSSSSQPTSEPTSPATTAADYGDVVVLKTVKDSLGSYQQTTIKSSDDSMKLNNSIIQQSAKDTGYTDAQILAAQQTVAKFVAEEGLDSSAIDNSGAWDAWKSANKDSFATSQQNAILNGASTVGADRPGIINNDAVYGGIASNPVFIRDGKPRIANSKITVTSVEGGSDPAVGKYLTFKLTGVTNYRVSDAEALKFVKSKGFGSKASAAIQDGKGENLWTTKSDIGYSLSLENGKWKIAGFKTNFSSDGDGWVNK